MDHASSVVTEQANDVTEVQLLVEEKVTDLGMHSFQV